MDAMRSGRVVIASTRAAAGVYDDRTGPIIVEWLNQRGIVTVVVRFAATKPELDTLSAKQVPAELRRERNDDLGGHRDRSLGIIRQQRQ